MRFFIRKEIQETSEAATLFRGVSLTTKMVSAFCMQEGQAYCRNASFILFYYFCDVWFDGGKILDPCIKLFCTDEVSIEVDPSKLTAGDNLDVNQAKLLGICKGLLNRIFLASIIIYLFV